MFGICIIVMIAWLINTPDSFFILIGIHLLVTIVMLLKEDGVILNLVEKNNNLNLIFISSMNFVLYTCCLIIINHVADVGNIFYYLFGISLILTLIRLYYSPALLKKSYELIKRYKESEKLAKEGNTNAAFLAILGIKGASMKLGRKMFFVFSLPMIFMAIVLYWFYIKTLIIIDPGFFIIALIIISLVAESVLEYFSRSARQILIEKQIDDGNK
jgi:hypothetical protein